MLSSLVTVGVACALSPFSSSLAIAKPDVSLAGLDLSLYRGKVVYLDFWASWCAPCKLSFPYMQRMALSYPSSKFAIIAVNVDHSRASADAFLAQVGADVPVIFDPKGDLAAKYQVKAMPTSVLFDRSGHERFVHQGFFEDKIDLYEAHISELLNEQ